jgi:hypothetical protein
MIVQKSSPAGALPWEPWLSSGGGIEISSCSSRYWRAQGSGWCLWDLEVAVPACSWYFQGWWLNTLREWWIVIHFAIKWKMRVVVTPLLVTPLQRDSLTSVRYFNYFRHCFTQIGTPVSLESDGDNWAHVFDLAGLAPVKFTISWPSILFIVRTSLQPEKANAPYTSLYELKQRTGSWHPTWCRNI